MFSRAATKIAHNPTINLGIGNQDLRPLQQLITAEKTVLVSFQKLAVDFTKAAESVRTWGLGEGDDLADILSASTAILGNFATALTQYASHEHVIRDGMKSVRTREEALDELKRRRRAVLSRAEAAERKLSKMSPEHKNLMSQTEMLNQLRDQIRGLDGDIMTEEAALSDFKRSSVRTFMGLKFGGLLEFCEKGTIIGEYGKLIISETPETITQPGFPREMYNNHNKVASLLMEAQRCVEDVKLTTVNNTADPQQFRPLPRITNPDDNTNSSPNSPTTTDFSSRFGTDVSPLPSGMGPPPAVRGGGDLQLNTTPGLGSGHFLDPSDLSTNPPSSLYPSSERTPIDEFSGGTSPSSTLSGPSGGRFATFPVKNRQGVSLRDEGFVKASHTGPTIADTSPLDPATATRGQFQGMPTPSGDAAPPPLYESSSSHLPPGAAPPEIRNSAYENVGLAYMMDDGGGTEEESEEQRTERLSRHVRFGGGSDVDIDAELDRRAQQKMLSPEEEERELNAAAAREVTRELDALAFNPPPPVLESPRPLFSTAPNSFSEPLPESERPGGGGRRPSDASSTHRNPSPFSRRPAIDTNYSPATQQPSYSSPAVENPPVPSISLPPDRSFSEGGTPPYRTPPQEFPAPRTGGGGIVPPYAGPFHKSTSSVNSLSGNGSGPGGGGGGKISAAAFRRPVPRLGTGGGGGPNGGTSLPSSPYPRGTSPLPGASSPLVNNAASPIVPGGGGASPLPAPSGMGGLQKLESMYGRTPPQGGGERTQSEAYDDTFDYISSYISRSPDDVTDAQGSPIKSDYGTLGNMRVVN